MNAMMVLFFLSILINDYIFKEGVLIKIYIYLFLAYVTVYIFTKRSKFHSTYKHALLAIFSQSYDPTIYGKVKLPTKKLKEFLEAYNKKHNIKVSWTLLLTKIFGNAIKAHPEFNTTIKCGFIMPRDTVDISVLVNLEGKNLAKKTLLDVNKKSLKQLNEELYSSVKNTRAGKDCDFNKQTQLLGLMPSYLSSILMEIVGYLANLGITIKPLGVEKNAFGTIMVTSVGGSFGIEDAYAPLLSFTHTVGIATICSTRKKITLTKNGEDLEEDLLGLNFSLDHRYMDGMLIARLINFLRDSASNPEKIDNL